MIDGELREVEMERSQSLRIIGKWQVGIGS